MKVFGTIFAAVLLGLFATQVSQVSANNKNHHNRPLTSPISGPCKPGWGWGDKKHCHSGPPGLKKFHNAFKIFKGQGNHHGRH